MVLVLEERYLITAGSFGANVYRMPEYVVFPKIRNYPAKSKESARFVLN
jgi:hypothetical protein